MDVGSPQWLQATDGVLGRSERLRLLARIAGQAPLVLAHRGWAEVWRHRRSRGTCDVDVTAVPASAAAQTAAAACQRARSPAFVNHSHRTWLFGMALAAHDGAADELDAETFFVAAMLHDLGLAEVHAGCCFTRAGTDAALTVAGWTSPGSAPATAAAAAVSDHITPGVSRRDNPHGYYLQRGSLLDLTGVRAASLPRDFVWRVFERHPAHGVKAEAPMRWRAEAEAVRHGRADLLERWGRFSLMARVSPLPPPPPR